MAAIADAPASVSGRALVLGGGGARGSYQAGAALAIMEIASEADIERPFSILSGLSAGALNAAYLASHPDSPVQAARELVAVWSAIRAEQVYRADVGSLAKIGFGWLYDLTLGGLKSDVRVKALLDTAPLRRLLRTLMPLDKLRAGLDGGLYDSLVITAASYTTLQAVSFVETRRDVADEPGPRPLRVTQLSRDHVLASTAIPLFFRPVLIEGQFYGDGAVKNTAPLSGATKMGATSMCVIGVHRHAGPAPEPPRKVVRPTAARILGTLLDTLFMDYLDTDVDRLVHINRILEGAPGQRNGTAGHQQRVIRPLYLLPSEDVGEIALRYIGSAPRTIRYLMKGLGSEPESVDLLSYLLFEAPYCAALAELGYRDARDRKSEVLAFLEAGRARGDGPRKERRCARRDDVPRPATSWMG